MYGLNELSNIEYDEVHLANIHVETLYSLLSENVPKNKIVIANYRLYLEYVRKEESCDIRLSFPLVMTRPMSMVKSVYSSTINFLGSKMEASYDYVRYMTLKLLANEIEEHKIPGEIAELGVFQGDFASMMNAFLPSRSLNLFDTFEGFPNNDKLYEIEQGYTKADKFLGKGEFENTSIKMVMEKMPYPEKCIIHQGYFPDTIPKVEKQYALVSLDCDLYKPMLAGLRYFVPRLVKQPGNM